MDNLGKDIVKVYEKKQDYLKSGVVISFAETGTALGHSVFNYINSDYEFIHTTREKVKNKESLHFLEEHSHATNHNLYYEDLKYLKDKEEIILVDDEITTGNTCINLIKKINEFVSSNCNLQACTLAQEINKIFVETFGTDVYDENLEQCTIVAKKILRVEM